MPIVLTIMILFAGPLKAPDSKSIAILEATPIRPYDAIFKAVCRIESNNNPFAVGDKHLKGYSYGIAQIRQIKLDDYFRLTGIRYTTDDMFDVVKAKEVFVHHMMQYNDVDYAVKRWNGKGVTTLAYLEKVKRYL